MSKNSNWELEKNLITVKHPTGGYTQYQCIGPHEARGLARDLRSLYPVARIELRIDGNVTYSN